MSYRYPRHSPAQLLAIFLLGMACSLTASAQAPPHEYPRTVLYQGILHLLITLRRDAPVYNFKSFYTVGFPVGVHI